MEHALVTLLICSATMSALALFYMALTPLLARRYSVTARYYAWLVIVVGLIIPFRPRFGRAVVQIDLPAAGPVVGMGNGLPAAVPAHAVPALPSALPQIAWWQAAAVVWLAGMVLFLGYHVLRHMRFLKLTARWSEPVTDGPALALLQDLKTQMGLSRPIGLQVCRSIGSPMLIGVRAPRILLPSAAFAEDELRFVLKHELVHYRQGDLWYKGLVLLATAIHWFNPVVYLMAKSIGVQCELSCDEKVVRGTGAAARQSYSETIIGVVRYQSKLQTAFSTNFYGGKKGMKTRIFSIMDMGRKKAGVAVLGGALFLTLGTGVAFAAGTEPQIQPGAVRVNTVVAPQFPVAFLPDPDVYAPYAAFGVTISADGTQLLYGGQPVHLFVDEGADTEAFYLGGAGGVDLSVARNAAGEITGLEPITAQQAQAYQDAFFAEEGGSPLPAGAQPEEQDNVEVRDTVQVGTNKYDQYQPFGLTYAPEDGTLTFQGQRVKLLADQVADGWFAALWEDDAGTVNLKVLRDGSGQITGVASITEADAQTYRSAADQYEQDLLDGLEARIEDRLNQRYAEN